MLHLQEFKIQNIVGSCDVKFPIRLEGLSMAHGYFATVSPLPCCPTANTAGSPRHMTHDSWAVCQSVMVLRCALLLAWLADHTSCVPNMSQCADF
jgi:hypothetical protein